MEFTEGMNPDINLYSALDNSWAMAKNVRRVNGVIEVDYGIVDVASLGGEVVGVCNTGKIVYIFTSESESRYNDRIYKYDGVTVSTIIQTNLGLSPSIEIEIVYKYNDLGDVLIAWIGGDKPLRVINTTNLPLISGIDSISYIPINADELKLTYVKPRYNYTDLQLTTRDDGNLSAGVYQVSIRYKYKDVITDWIPLSNRVIIEGRIELSDAIEQNYDGAQYADSHADYLEFMESEEGNNGLILTIPTLDSSYDTIDVAIIRSLMTGDMESTATVQYDIPIASYTNTSIVITDLSDTYITVDELLGNHSSIFKPKSITNFNSNLLIGGYTSTEQDVTNSQLIDNITLQWVAERLLNSDGTSDDASRHITFQWGEVYAFYAAYVYDDDTVGPYHHIQGAAPTTTQGDAYSTTVTPNSLSDNARYFHIIDTSTTIGVLDSGEVYGNFGVWENENEIDGESGNPMRHFRFPHRYAIKNALGGTNSNWADEFLLNSKLGVRVHVDSTNLPTGVKSIKIAYAKRDLTNATVLDSGLSSCHLAYNYTTLSYERTDARHYHPLLVNNRYIPSHMYQVGIHDRSYIIPANATAGTFLQCSDVEFKIEHNGEHENWFTGDCISSSPNEDIHLITNKIMNDIRDIYNNVYNQTLVPMCNVELDTHMLTYSGDVVKHKMVSMPFRPNTYSYEFENYMDDLDVTMQAYYSIVTGLMVQAYMEMTGQLLYEDFADYENYEYGVLTLSIDRWYSRLRGMTTLPIGKPGIMASLSDNIINTHNNTIIISESDNTVENNWLQFDPNNCYKIPNINGSIFQLVSYANTVFIRTDRSIYVAKIRDTFDMTNGAVGIKSGELFDQRPQELIPTSNGMMSGNSKYGTYTTKVGVVMIDITTASIYLIGESMTDLTITNKEYFKSLFENVQSTHFSSLMGCAVMYDEGYNRLYITIGSTTLTFDVMTKQLISTHNLGNIFPFAIKGIHDPFYIYKNDSNAFKIGQLTDNVYPDEAYIDIAIAFSDALSFGLNDVAWLTYGGVMNTVKAISIWTHLGATGIIDIVRNMDSNGSQGIIITGNTSFDVDGVYRFNEIFDNVIQKELGPTHPASDTYDISLYTSNIDTTLQDTELFGTLFKVRLYLKKSGESIDNRNCKLKRIDLTPRQYTSKY